MKSVAFYLPNLAAGGAERTFLRLAAGFKERGCPVRLVVDRPEGGLLETVQNSGLALDVLHAGRTLSAFPKLGAWLRHNTPDVLLSAITHNNLCLLYTSPSPRDGLLSRMPSSA